MARCTHLLAALLPLLAASAVLAQGAGEGAASPPEETEAVGAGAASGQDAGREEALDRSEDPLAAIEAAERAQDPEMDAELEAFDPSERISEDRSVSFPNDI